MVKYGSKTEKGKCIFCEITNKKIEPLGGGLFYESKKYMAWLSPFPCTDGNTVIVPKKHLSSDVLSISDKELSEFILEAKKVSKILMKQFKDVGRVGLIMEGLGVDHAHIKLIPMHKTSYLKKGEWKQILSNKEEFHTEYPGYLISSDGPKADFKKIKILANKLKKLKS